MKKILLFASALVAMIISSCEKQDNTIPVSSTEIVGTWIAATPSMEIEYQLESESIVLPQMGENGEDLILNTTDIDQMSAMLIDLVTDILNNPEAPVELTVSSDNTFAECNIRIDIKANENITIYAKENGNSLELPLFETESDLTWITVDYAIINNDNLQVRLDKDQITEIISTIVTSSAASPEDTEELLFISLIESQIRSLNVYLNLIRK